MQEEELENGKEVLKYVLERLSMMVKRTVHECTDVHEIATYLTQSIRKEAKRRGRNQFVFYENLDLNV